MGTGYLVYRVVYWNENREPEGMLFPNHSGFWIIPNPEQVNSFCEGEEAGYLQQEFCPLHDVGHSAKKFSVPE